MGLLLTFLDLKNRKWKVNFLPVLKGFDMIKNLVSMDFHTDLSVLQHEFTKISKTFERRDKNENS